MFNNLNVFNKKDEYTQKETEMIEFLNRYTLGAGQVKLVKNIKEIEEAEIPLYWKNALKSSDRALAKKIILDEWKKYCGKELSNTILYLEQHLKEIQLISIAEEFSLGEEFSIEYLTEQYFVNEGVSLDKIMSSNIKFLVYG